MSTANIEMKCFSAAQRPCSFLVFKARATILQLCDRRAPMSRPIVFFSSLVDSPELPPSEPKLGSYNDPLSSEKLKRIRMLRSQNIVKKETDLETKSADSHFSNFKVADFELEQAQFQARERARILLVEAEQATIIAAQAIDVARTHGESLNNSLLEAWALLDEANRSISKLKMKTMSTN
ncbi:hypothetical protein KP509_28G047200 [Ceratopteris richardii]|uniref:Uncharacterized protein n=1 Tax=Ceratopteris richardii TaxID=49495 RepID=A0A8T2RDH3_CERRI|nr:hypothetical protein KP509_28G047200 [Ceratopteris richardii]